MLLFVICGFIFSCSTSKKSLKQRNEPVVLLSETQKLAYDHDFIEATRLKILGNLPDAASMLTRCVEINPYDAAAYFQLAEIYSIINDRKNALRYSRLAVQNNDRNEWYKLQLANIFLAEKKLDSAIVVYRQILNNKPYDADMRFSMSILYSENNEYRKALKEIDYIEKIYGFSEETAIARYKIFSKKGDFKNTEAVLKKGIKYFPDELRFYGLLAEIYGIVGREQDAQAYYKKLLDVDPENPIGFISMIEFYKDYGNDEKAIEEMKRMYEMKNIDPDHKAELYLQLSADSVFFKKNYKAMDMLVKQLFERHPDNFRIRVINADRNLRENNYEGAKDDLLFITSRMQTNYQIWEHLFHILYLLQDNETLYESTGKALEYFRDRYLFYFFRGFSASMLNHYEEAIPAYFRTLECMRREKVPDKEIEFQTYVFLGEACNHQKRFQEADFAFDEALLMSPNNTLVLNNYSYYLSLREEKLDLAERYIKRCITLEPHSSTYLDTYGWVLYKLGRFNEAIIMIEKAVRSGGHDSPEIIEHYCELLTIAGRTEEACNICQYAIELQDSDETVEEKMNAIIKNNEKKDILL